MKPYDLTQLDACASGQILPMITGKLVNLWERKSGENDRGGWSFQRGYIAAPDGTKVPLQLKDREELPQSWRDKTITITSKDGQKGLNGIKVIDEEYNNETQRKLRITPTATITEEHQAAQQQPAQQPAQQHQPADQDGYDRSWDDPQHPDNQKRAVAQEHQQPTGRTSPSGGSEKLKDAKRTICQIANLHILCRMAVERQEKPLVKATTGRDMSEGEIQAATSSLFIKADRLGMHAEMPTHPFKAEDFGG